MDNDQLINLYIGDPTPGGIDGTLVDLSTPISVQLNAAKNEVKYIRAALRCAEGYTVSSADQVNLTVYHPDGNGGWASPTVQPFISLGYDTLSKRAQKLYTLTSNPESGDTFTLGDVTLTAGTDFEIVSESFYGTLFYMIKAFMAASSSLFVKLDQSIYSQGGVFNWGDKALSHIYDISDIGSGFYLTEIYPGGGANPPDLTTSGDAGIVNTLVQSSTLGDPPSSSASYSIGGRSWSDTQFVNRNVPVFIKLDSYSPSISQAVIRITATVHELT